MTNLMYLPCNSFIRRFNRRSLQISNSSAVHQLEGGQTSSHQRFKHSIVGTYDECSSLDLYHKFPTVKFTTCEILSHHVNFYLAELWNILAERSVDIFSWASKLHLDNVFVSIRLCPFTLCGWASWVLYWLPISLLFGWTFGIFWLSPNIILAERHIGFWLSAMWPIVAQPKKSWAHPKKMHPTAKRRSRRSAKVKPTRQPKWFGWATTVFWLCVVRDRFFGCGPDFFGCGVGGPQPMNVLCD